MNKLGSKFGVFALVTLIAACGSDHGRHDRGDNGPGYVSLLQERIRFHQRYGLTNPNTIEETITRNMTDPGRMPRGGTAEYIGVGTVDLPDTQKILAGRAALTGDFGTKELSGRINSFKAEPGNTAGGSINIDATIIGPAVVGDATGSVSLNDQNYRVDEVIGGVFFGDEADSVGLATDNETSGIGILITADQR